ncbi:hypothetical protein [Stenotrophomonas sp.]|uniref:hypothetical protein n=1 Tax=Stenotrophomonas sp. TaxID=69392 RepID=UPI0028A0124D|nr:hypothetical protein [Stenotrophomonas sp.]
MTERCVLPGFLLALVGFGLSGCLLRTDAVVSIKNVSAHDLDHVVLEAGGDRVELDQLVSGARHTLRPNVTGDSSVRIVYREGDASIVCEGDVYLTNNMHVVVEAEIGGGVCRVADVTR